MNLEQTGKVFLVGAGPGDPSLLTVRAADILRKADVVIADRLVSDEIIAEYVNTDALVITAGKQGGSAASVSQKEINHLLVKMAKRFENVVRLKGGDVSLFSNVLDELETLVANNIPYEIIPGISALSGASAYAGIPLTARGLATGVRILTYYQHTAIAQDAWKELALFNDTLVFYMSGNSLHEVVKKLLEAGADASIPFVVIEQATTPNQYVHLFTLNTYNIIHQLSNVNFISPSLVIMGKVAGLYEQFAWLPNDNKRVNHFAELDGQNILTGAINTYQTQLHVSRA